MHHNRPLLSALSIGLMSILTASVLSCQSESKASATDETNFCDNIHRNDSISLSAEIEDFKTLMQDKTGVYVLEDGGGSMITRAWLTEYAEKTIDIQYFIFSVDNVGLIACDYLVRAADRGVKVRILVDDIMVDADAEDILVLDAHENITVKIYNPGVNLGKNLFGKLKTLVTDFRGANQRMHNKTFVVDGKIVITGGRNIADEYFDYDHEYNFRDRDVLLLGKVSQSVNQSFESFWNHELSINASTILPTVPENIDDPGRYDKLHEYACNPDNFWPQVRDQINNLPMVFPELRNSDAIVWTDDVYFVSDDPGKNDETQSLGGGGRTTTALIDLIQSAKTSIDIQSPYLVTTAAGRRVFQEAIERGVRIRILTNSLASTDNVEAFSGYQKNREDLLNMGVRIFEFRPDAKARFEVMTGVLQSTIDHKPIFGHHAKTMVVDGYTTVIGTFNLDPRSANLNTECITIINSKTIADRVLEGINEEFKPENSWETTLEFNPDSEVSRYKRIKTWTRKLIPKDIL